PRGLGYGGFGGRVPPAFDRRRVGGSAAGFSRRLRRAVRPVVVRSKGCEANRGWEANRPARNAVEPRNHHPRSGQPSERPVYGEGQEGPHGPRPYQGRLPPL